MKTIVVINILKEEFGLYSQYTIVIPEYIITRFARLNGVFKCISDIVYQNCVNALHFFYDMIVNLLDG